MMRHRRERAWLPSAIVLAWSTFAGLGALPGYGAEAQASAEPQPLESVAERGPLQWRVRIMPAEVLVGDPVRIVREFRAPEGHVVEFPPLPEFDALDVVSRGAVEKTKTAAGMLVWRQTSTAEPLLSGDLTLPALEVRYGRVPDALATQPSATAGAVADALAQTADAAQADELQPLLDQTLASTPLTLTVRSALTAADDVLNPREITGVVGVPQSFWARYGWWLSGAALGAAAVLALVLWLVLRRARPTRARGLIPEAWARDRLAEVARRERWHADMRGHYYRLSEIVRLYIELKFDLAAGEMTTEEFLRELVRQPAAVPFDPSRLRELLESWDLAKYAAANPGPEQARAALAAAERFVNETAAATREPAHAHAAPRTTEAAA